MRHNALDVSGRGVTLAHHTCLPQDVLTKEVRYNAKHSATAHQDARNDEKLNRSSYLIDRFSDDHFGQDTKLWRFNVERLNQRRKVEHVTNDCLVRTDTYLSGKRVAEAAQEHRLKLL